MKPTVRIVAWALLVLPWVYPFASGPSPSVEPWLVTLGATALLLLLLSTVPGLRAEMPATIAYAWACAALLGTAMALLQYFGLSQLLSPWVPVSAPGHAYGALRQRNQFATLTLMGVIALLVAVRLGGRWGYLLPAALILVAGNAASASRTGALGLLLLCLAPVVWPSLRNRRIVLFLLTCVLGYGSAAASLPVLLAQWTGVDAPTVLERITATPGCGSRTILWSNVAHLVAQKPWFGWGWGELDYAHYATLYPGPRFCDILDNAHLLPLHIAVELGLPAAVLVTLALAALVAARAPWRESQPYRQMAWLVLAAIALHSLVEYPLWYGPFCLAVGASIAVLCVPCGEAPAARWTRRARTGLGFAAGALLGATLYAAWDYWRVSQVYLPQEARSPAYRVDPLSNARGSWLFRDQVQFAELTTTRVTRGNAAHMAQLSGSLLHYSPEPRIIRALIECLTLLGRDDEALEHLARFRAAFPEEYAQWRSAHSDLAPPVTRR